MKRLYQIRVGIAAVHLIQRALGWTGSTIRAAIIPLISCLVVVSAIGLAETGGLRTNLKQRSPQWRLIGELQITAYQPLPQQTRKGCNGIHDCFTSIGDVPTKFGAAVSQDLLANGTIHYGDPIYIENFGYRLVNDTMNRRHRNAVDLMVWTHADEKAVGVRHLKVYVVRQEK